MEHVTLCLRTEKSKGTIKLRFRLRDGREIQLYHKSNIEAEIADLSKFTLEGTVKPKTTIYNKQLATKITQEIDAMKKAYATMKQKSMVIDSSTFEEQISLVLNPESGKPRTEDNSLLTRFEKFANDAHRDGVIGVGRYRHYQVLLGKLERYLTIKQSKKITPQEFNDEWLLDFRQFVFDEYKYVKRYKSIYDGLNGNTTPKERRSSNTVTAQMKMLQSFFTELESRDEIMRNPFRRLSTERRRIVMKTKFDEPFFLNAEEFLQVMNADVPDDLVEVKKAFLLQCAFGCRISDFKAMSMNKISVTKDGIPYVHYLPIKTKNAQYDNREVETPILRYALDIIKESQFNFNILKYYNGKSGYNVKIKDLLKHCEVFRKVAVYDEATADNKYERICDVASSKLCRKTHVDMMNKVQINMYAAGLHKEGSDAVERYTKLDIKDRFVLMCAAFKQPMYKVDENLNVIEEK